MKDYDKFLSYALRNGLDSIYTGIIIRDEVLKEKNGSFIYGRIYKKIREDKHNHHQTNIYYIVVFKQFPINENLIIYKRTASLKFINQINKRWDIIKIK